MMKTRCGKIFSCSSVFFTLLELFSLGGCSIPFNKDIYLQASQFSHIVPAPTIALSPDKAFFLTTDNPSVSISCARAGAVLYYSIDNASLPTLYSGAFSIPYISGTSLRSIQTHADYPEYNSSVTSYAYCIFVPSGNIFTIAGVSTQGSYGDGTFGYYAALNSPAAIAYDSINLVLYIADTNNNQIRKIDATGRISTLVAAGLSSPSALFLDSSGTSLYVADTGNNLVKKIDLTTSPPTISIIAGTGATTYSSAEEGNAATSANLFSPAGICLNNSTKKMYVSDTGNNRIRYIDLTLPTPTITTLAGGAAGYAEGTGTGALFTGPTGICLNSPGSSLYVADTGNNRIRLVATDTGITSTFAGGASTYNTTTGEENIPATSANLSSPTGLDFAGNKLYIADSGNNRIRIVDNSLNISTLSGTGTAGYSDTENNGPAANAMLNVPKGVCYDASGWFIADTGNNRVRKILNY